MLNVSSLEQIALESPCSSCWPFHLVSPSQLMNGASRKGKIRGVICRTAVRHLVLLWRCFCSWRNDHVLYTQTVPPYVKATSPLLYLSSYYPSKKMEIHGDFSHHQSATRLFILLTNSHLFATISHNLSNKIHKQLKCDAMIYLTLQQI